MEAVSQRIAVVLLQHSGALALRARESTQGGHDRTGVTGTRFVERDVDSECTQWGLTRARTRAQAQGVVNVSKFSVFSDCQGQGDGR